MFKRIWHPEMIQSHIMSRIENKEPLNALYYATNYPDAYAAAERLFGSWRATIEACGIDYSTVRKYKIWNRGKVLAEIRALYAKHELIHSQNAQRNYKALYMAAIKRFGNWGNAVEGAGIDYTTVRRRRTMSEDDIRKAVLELYRQRQDLSYTNMRRNYQFLLAAAMKKLGQGSWARARKKCGILKNYRFRKKTELSK
jgi:hypothetical protein